jgi:hypothetical protein
MGMIRTDDRAGTNQGRGCEAEQSDIGRANDKTPAGSVVAMSRCNGRLKKNVALKITYYETYRLLAEKVVSIVIIYGCCEE